MQFQNNFDLEEFLAYLLPGFVCAILLYIKWAAANPGHPTLTQFGPEYAVLFFFIVFFVAASLAIGHVCSVLSRNLLRPLVYLLLGDPELSIFSAHHRFTTDKSFYSAKLIEAISQRFHKVFGIKMEEPQIAKAAPRLIRTYVLLHAPMVVTVRERIVRARSICANSVFAILLAILLFHSIIGYVNVIMLLGSAILLVVKQISLDIRESKEIYTGFLGLDLDRVEK